MTEEERKNVLAEVQKMRSTLNKIEELINPRKLGSRNKSGYRGVTWNKEHRAWKAQIFANNKSVHIGYYDSKLDAAFARDQFVIDNKLSHVLNFAGSQ